MDHVLLTKNKLLIRLIRQGEDLVVKNKNWSTNG